MIERILFIPNPQQCEKIMLEDDFGMFAPRSYFKPHDPTHNFSAHVLDSEEKLGKWIPWIDNDDEYNMSSLVLAWNSIVNLSGMEILKRQLAEVKGLNFNNGVLWNQTETCSSCWNLSTDEFVGHIYSPRKTHLFRSSEVPALNDVPNDLSRSMKSAWALSKVAQHEGIGESLMLRRKNHD